ncbi:malto-oligosyltrehalose synthase, partial [Pedobacter sp.]|uniref:malto-oligosyltrehalose synthase n=1 Tax=Pedobacter sp. TaxID=1411316 RepID=UPI003D7F6A98
MFNPISTYRIQFNKDFTFQHLQAILPFLQQLGVKTIYASPIFEAVPGSNHGYDAVNPQKINPEIGTLTELKRLSQQIKELGFSWIQDIVPNHMGFHHQNPWLMDVLKHGERSAYRHFFDILSPNLSEEPLMVPFLGDDLEKVIENKELELAEKSGGWFLKYHDSYWPLKPDTDLQKSLSEIASNQYYRLCNYQESNERLNYRRFFTVNSLICLNIQRPEVFDAYHQLTKQLLQEGIFQGLRIDHIDGLYDPEKYLQQLRQLSGEETYIVVEKILAPEESLPKAWPVEGTTGYDFLGLVNQVFINEQAEKKFDSFYQHFDHNSSSVQSQVFNKKADFLNSFMKPELDNLYQLFLSLNLLDGPAQTVEEAGIFKKLLAEIMVRCPVYRYYGNQYPLPPQEQAALKVLLAPLEQLPEYAVPVQKLKSLLFEQVDCDVAFQQRILQFYQRLMQFTGPLMAKGVEDTLMYTYNRFIGSNEVGDSPDVFGISIADFHRAVLKRQEDFPLSMNALSTHDTKRGEDARARLQVLTDFRKYWLDEVQLWIPQNQELKQQDMPDSNDAYFIYQTLVATYPETEEEQSAYAERLQTYIEKALRESKRNSSWDEPDATYEQYTKDFIEGLLDTKRPFWKQFITFHQRICFFGKLNSLAALLLKLGCPGVPDTYQGNGLWDLSMVDPDNRRAVDYTLREQYLQEIMQDENNLSALWQQSENGKIK